jgi:DegV family protein with EDD domain
MQIVTDRGMDLAPSQLEGLDINFAPLRIILDGKTYTSGEDLQPEEFYRMLSETESYPTTTMPSIGDFTQIYRNLAEKDPEILSIHISSGLSGTINSAKAAAALVPEANITIVDSMTLSVPFGWQVEAAANAIKAGWPKERILDMLQKLRENSQAMYTLASLKYLIHGGRISHIKGLLASILKIKPIIGVEKEHGTYYQLGQEMTLKRSIQKIVEVVAGFYAPGSVIRVQLLHGDNPEGVEILREKLKQVFDVVWEPVTAIAPVLGAHTGPSVVGLAVAPTSIFEHF